MEDIKFYGGMILAIVVVGLLLGGAVVGIAIFAEKNYCSTMQSIHTGFEFQWQLWGGCLVETPSGYWISAHDYNYLEGDVQ